MWSPTHVQVTVQRARGLQYKGTNGILVTIGLGKEKYQTSIKERETDRVDWHEKCELQIPKHGNTAVITLTALSQNFLGVDQFVGCVRIPLSELDVYERPKNKWYELRDKHGKEKTKERGELEVKIGFSVKPGSLMDISKKDRKGSLGQLAHNIGGSLASIGSTEKKSFRKLAKSITRKMKKDKKLSEESLNFNKLDNGLAVSKQAVGDADPGVISDDEFAFDDLSHTGSGCSLEVVQSTGNSISDSTETVASSAGTSPNISKDTYSNFTSNTLPPQKPPRSITPIQEKFVQKWEQKIQESKKTKSAMIKSSERIVVGGESKPPVLPASSKLSPELLHRFGDKSREQLIQVIHNLQMNVDTLSREKKEMEDYIDNLLLRVIDEAPQILQNPYNTR